MFSTLHVANQEAITKAGRSMCRAGPHRAGCIEIAIIQAEWDTNKVSRCVGSF